MPNFVKGRTYCIPEENEELFLYKSFHNERLLNDITSKGPEFTVLEVQEDCNGDSATKVRFEGTGEISLDGFYLTPDEREYFEDVTDGKGSWRAGTIYRCVNLVAISSSAINSRFVKEVGKRVFKVTKMMNDCERTSEIEYVHNDGYTTSMKITFTPGEYSYFEVFSPGEVDEVESPICSMESLEEQIDVIQDPEEFEEWTAEVEGVMVFKIESEAERKQAIEILKTMKWKK